jgi:hypothetical protein
MPIVSNLLDPQQLQMRPERIEYHFTLEHYIRLEWKGSRADVMGPSMPIRMRIVTAGLLSLREQK